jgi:hypothetical protein
MTAGIKKVFRTALTDVKLADYEGVGTLRFEGNAIYKWVAFNGTTAVAAGTPVCYVTSDITESTVDGALSALPAGISNNAVSALGGTITGNQYAWIQLTGPTTLANAPSGSPAVGSVLYIGSTAGTLGVVTAATQRQIATSIDGSKTAQLSFAF